MGQKWMVVLGLALGIQGCADIQEARKIQDPANARPGEKTVLAKDVGLDGATALTFERGLEIAQTNNPQVGLARAVAEQMQAKVEEARSGFLPLIVGNADVHLVRAGGAGSNPLTGSQLGHSGIFQADGGSVTLNQLIYDFGKTPAIYRQVLNQWISAQSSYDSILNDTAFNFKQAFFNVLKQEELVTVGEETVRQFQKRLEQTTVFVQVGSRQKYDLTKAQVDLGNAQLTLVKARTGLALGRTTLNNTLGLAEDPLYKVERPKSKGEWSLDFEEALRRARANHPKLLSLILLESAARAAVDAAIADFYPALTLQGSFSWQGSLTPLTWFSFLGPALSYVIFSGWEKTGFLHETVAGLRQAYANRAQEEQLVFLDLRSGYTQLEDARESLKILVLTVKEAEEQLELAQGRYTAGKASAVDLTDAQVALATARANEIQARWDFEVAVAALERSIGGMKSK